MPKYLRKMTKRMIRARYFPQGSQLEDIFLSEEVYCSLPAEVLNTFGWLQYIRRIMFVQRDRFICETNYKRAHLTHEWPIYQKPKAQKIKVFSFMTRHMLTETFVKICFLTSSSRIQLHDKSWVRDFISASVCSS